MPEPIVFTSSTPRFALPLLFSGQSQKEFFVNQAHALLDVLVHPVIEGMSDTPPTAPVEGDTWLVVATANGVWSGQEDKLANYVGSQWLFISPQAGMRVFLRNSSQFYLFDNAWMGASEPAVPNGGTTVDVEARDAIADLIEVLRVSGILAQP